MLGDDILHCTINTIDETTPWGLINDDGDILYKNYLAKKSLFSNALVQLYSSYLPSCADLLKWAYNVVRTRYHENDGGDYCIAPMAGSPSVIGS